MRLLALWLVAAACGGAAPAPATTTTFKSSELRSSKDDPRPMIPPSRLEPLRVAGDKFIKPDDQKSLRGKYKFCVDVTGKVGDIEKLQSSGDAHYDAKIERDMQQWAYHPVIVDGQPSAVCSEITFIFNQR